MPGQNELMAVGRRRQAVAPRANPTPSVPLPPAVNGEAIPDSGAIADNVSARIAKYNYNSADGAHIVTTSIHEEHETARHLESEKTRRYEVYCNTVASIANSRSRNNNGSIEALTGFMTTMSGVLVASVMKGPAGLGSALVGAALADPDRNPLGNIFGGGRRRDRREDEYADVQLAPPPDLYMQPGAQGIPVVTAPPPGWVEVITDQGRFYMPPAQTPQLPEGKK